jgi:hypothetical protein
MVSEYGAAGGMKIDRGNQNLERICPRSTLFINPI